MSTAARDLIVIGGGAGGLSAARAAVRHGARPTLVQDGPLGGDCTFTGCVPSKALIDAANSGADFPCAMEVVRHAVETVAAAEADEVLRSEGVDIVHGRARFVSRREIAVNGSGLRSERFVIATGATPAAPAIEGLEGAGCLTSANVFALTTRPASLAVLGGGSIGCELAQAFARLGSKVTVLEAGSRLLPNEEPEASEVILHALRDEEIDIRLGQVVRSIERTAGGVTIHLGDGAMVVASELLVATGRQGATRGLGLSAAGVARRGTFVQTDDAMRTSARGIFAVGDVAGGLQLTHAADEMGRVAAANALHRRPVRRFRADRIPRVTFTDPEVARVGMAEADAAARGATVAWLPMTELDRAIVSRQTRGFVKLLAGPRPILRRAGGGRILGATIVASRGGELINEVALAMRTNMFVGRLAQTVHAYPTWSVGVQQAAAQFFFETGGRRARPALRGPDD